MKVCLKLHKEFDMKNIIGGASKFLYIKSLGHMIRTHLIALKI